MLQKKYLAKKVNNVLTKTTYILYIRVQYILNSLWLLMEHMSVSHATVSKHGA